MKWTEEEYTGKKLFIGKYLVAGVVHTCRSEPKEKYKAYCLLPGIKEHLGYYPDVKSAAEKIDRLIGVWLHNTGLREGAK